MRVYPTIKERFWSMVSPEPNSGCWLWTGDAIRQGYGRIRINSRKQLAHRVAWTLFKGPIPSGKGYHGICVLHKCDTPGCVNPDHLFLGTHTDNMRDRIQKGRDNTPMGDACKHAKLTTIDVVTIRLWIQRGMTKRECAKHFNVSPSTISAIARGKNWKHVGIEIEGSL